MSISTQPLADTYMCSTTVSLTSLKVPELRSKAKKMGLRNYSKLRKAELISLIKDNSFTEESAREEGKEKKCCQLPNVQLKPTRSIIDWTLMSLSVREKRIIEEWVLIVDKYPELSNWGLKFSSQMTRCGGITYITKKKIVLSRHMIKHSDTRFEEVLNTLLHESAHAMCAEIYGRDYTTKYGKYASHGPEWVKQATKMGCDGKKCHKMKFAQERKKKAPYQFRCTTCHISCPRFKPLTASVYTCSRCKTDLIFEKNTLYI